ncbi:MAG: class I SAM-dependent methyltransferase [Deltaproteobacteria bacterium]|nr:class I SAM-dependent methyltransferase [Deltaproteobacteria bacterium]
MSFHPIKAVSERLNKKLGKHIIRQEIQNFKTELRVLDLGCGQSPSSHIFPNRVSVDINPAPGVHVITDAHYLPFKSGSFQQIICSEVLEHLSNPKQAVKEMARVLGDNGRLVLTMPFIYPIHEAPCDYQRFTIYGLKKLFNNYGFKIEQIKALYTEEQTLAILLQRIAFQRDDSPIRHYLYLLIAYLLFRCPVVKTHCYQDISRRVTGPFLTAGYLLVARRGN